MPKGAATLEGIFYFIKMTTAAIPYSKRIHLTQNKYTLVNYWVYEFLIQWKWVAAYRHKNWYAHCAVRLRKGEYRNLYIHRIILNVWDSKVFVDHIDHNGLNNLIENIRICTHSQNAKNCRPKGFSKYLGVSKNYSVIAKKEYIYWIASISICGKKTTIKRFSYTPEGEIEAAKAYDEAAKKYHGEFANLNFKTNPH